MPAHNIAATGPSPPRPRVGQAITPIAFAQGRERQRSRLGVVPVRTAWPQSPPLKKEQGAGKPTDKVVVLSGLQPGETIVTSGNFLIDSESRLSAATADMSSQKN